MPHTTHLDTAPQRGRSVNMQWATGCDVSLGDLAEGGQSCGIHKSDAGEVDVQVLFWAQRVEGGTQQWSSRHVNFALHDHNCHVIDVKPVNLQTTIDQCHDILRPRPNAHSDRT
jgi:hypothetical protein